MSVARVRSLLEQRGLLARRDLGQNFLVDEELARRLAERAGLAPGDSALEIGTGLGVLTRALAERAARVVTLEVDSGLVRALREESLLPEGVELIHADALRVDLAELVRGLEPPVRAVANLPYVVAAPLLRRLLDLRGALAGWAVMVQREMAERLCAEPGTRAYAPLTVLHRLLVRVERVMELSPRCFFPVPQVRSTFLRIEPLARPLLAPDELAQVEATLRAAFSARRKTLVNALCGARPGPGCEPARVAAELESLGLDRRVRAEALPPEQLLALARALRVPA